MKKLAKSLFLIAFMAAVGIMLSGAAWAQTVDITAAVGVNTGSNRADYGVTGTVDGVGNMYKLTVQIKDGTGTPIETVTKTYTNGEANWHFNIKGVAGGVTAYVCLEDLAGLMTMGASQTCDDEDTEPIDYPVPATRTTGLLVLAFLIASVASIALLRRRASSNA